MWSIHIIESCSGIKKKWSTVTCYNMNLENIMLSERIQSQKITNCIISVKCNVHNREIQIDRK